MLIILRKKITMPSEAVADLWVPKSLSIGEDNEKATLSLEGKAAPDAEYNLGAVSIELELDDIRNYGLFLEDLEDEVFNEEEGLLNAAYPIKLRAPGAYRKKPVMLDKGVEATIWKRTAAILNFFKETAIFKYEGYVDADAIANGLEPLTDSPYTFTTSMMLSGPSFDARHRSLLRTAARERGWELTGARVSSIDE